MNGIIVRSVPRRWYWFMGIWLYPIASFVYVAVLLVPCSNLVGFRLAGWPLLSAWLVVTFAVSIWAYKRDYRRLHYTLTPDALIIGRGDSATTIPFSEIDSIVTGLPEKLPWWIRIQRFGGRPGTYPMMVAHWRTAPVLRLSASRYLPLSVAHGRMFLSEFDTLVDELLRCNKDKIVGRESYDESEICGLASARYNTIKTL